MPRNQPLGSRVRFLLKARPKRGALLRYGDRIAEVLGKARGQRVMIKSIHRDGVERRSAVKWTTLVPLDDQLFYASPTLPHVFKRRVIASPPLAVWLCK
jgi:hypothetical protein